MIWQWDAWWQRTLPSPLALVLITSSKMLQLSRQLLAITRTVYSVPGSSSLMTRKVLEELTVSDTIKGEPSPTEGA